MATPLPLPLAEVAAINATFPYNVDLGVRIERLDADGLHLLLPWQDRFGGSQVKQHMHGGVLASLIDVTCGMTLLAHTGLGAPTVDMRCDFHRGVGPVALRSVGRPLKLGRTVSVVDASVFDDQNRLVASGRALFSMGHGDALRG
jgi:uncharacterized protein (TIGR00369 family)